LKLERDFVVQTQLDSGIKSIERLKYDAKGSEWKEDTGQGAREDDVWVSKYRGVNREFAAGKWKAEIWIRKSKQQIGKSKHQHLGNFEEEQDAARAYDSAAKTRDGDKAVLNFPITEVEKSTAAKQAKKKQAAALARRTAEAKKEGAFELQRWHALEWGKAPPDGSASFFSV